MTHKLSIEAIKTLLIACHEAKRVVELQPPLPEGLTPGNLKVLDYIEYLERTAQPPKVSDIADLLQVTRPGITRLVSELQAINVIEKISDKQDKRIVRLRMTDEERKIHAYYIEQYHSWLHKLPISAKQISTPLLPPSPSFNFGLYLLLIIGFSSLIFATSIASDFGWFSIEVLALFAICLIALTAFYKQSLNSSTPLLRVQIFRYLPYTLSTASLLLVGFICLGLGFLIPNYAQLVSHTDAFTAGCLLLPGCIIGAMLAPISGRLLDKFGAQRPILLGNASILLSVICYSLYPGELSSLLFIVFYLFFAFGQGFSMGTIMTNGLSQLPEELNADSNAAMNTLLQLAGAVGTAVISTIVATAQAAEPTNIAHATMLGSRHGFFVLTVSAVLILCCSLKVFALIKKKNPAHA